MKKMISIAIIIMLCQHGFSQTWDEWFNQKKTQVKYLLQQIAANEIYIGYLQKGYKIAKNGLAAIGDIKNGEFNLHKDYFNSLKSVNPKIKNYARVADIIACGVQITKTYTNSYRNLRKSGQFTVSEINYYLNVYTKLLDETTTDIDELIKLITASEYEMKDDERMKGIDNLYNDMQGKYGFAKSFSNEANILAVQRINEKSETEISKLLYNIK